MEPRREKNDQFWHKLLPSNLFTSIWSEGATVTQKQMGQYLGDSSMFSSPSSLFAFFPFIYLNTKDEVINTFLLCFFFGFLLSATLESDFSF
jgi:hypothetical protein